MWVIIAKENEKRQREKLEEESRYLKEMLETMSKKVK